MQALPRSCAPAQRPLGPRDQRPAAQQRARAVVRDGQARCRSRAVHPLPTARRRRAPAARPPRHPCRCAQRPTASRASGHEGPAPSCGGAAPKAVRTPSPGRPHPRQRSCKKSKYADQQFRTHDCRRSLSTAGRPAPDLDGRLCPDDSCRRLLQCPCADACLCPLACTGAWVPWQHLPGRIDGQLRVARLVSQAVVLAVVGTQHRSARTPATLRGAARAARLLVTLPIPVVYV